MGGAMLEGFLRSDSFSASDISISNPHTDRLAPYAEQGVQVYADNRKAAAWGDVVFLVVKPWLYYKKHYITPCCSLAVVGINLHALLGIWSKAVGMRIGYTYVGSTETIRTQEAFKHCTAHGSDSDY